MSGFMTQSQVDLIRSATELKKVDWDKIFALRQKKKKRKRLAISLNSHLH